MNSISHQKQFKLSRLFTLCFAASVAIGAATNVSAASLGHSRLVSGAGQALRIHIPIKQITASELASLNVSPAPQQQWLSSGLTPPVDLSSLSIGLIDGPNPGSHVLVVSSQQSFDKQIADLLLDVKTDSGTQVYQVSILAQNDASVVLTPSAANPVSLDQARASAGSGTTSVSSGTSAGGNIVVHSGDTMFAIAKRNSVANASIYQLMIAMQRANPHAFINDNINLIKAGATLSMPDSSAINAISDTQARKIFNQQVLSFKQGFNLGDNQNVVGSVESTGTGDTVSAIVDEDLITEDDTDNNEIKETNDKNLDSKVVNVPVANSDESPAESIDKDDTAQEKDEADKEEAESPDNTASLTSGDSAENVSSDELKLSAMLNGAAEGLANSVSGTALAAQSSDALEDAKVAGDKAIEYTKDKISQLEENVKNLNKALTAQGNAASEAIIEGALEIQKALSDEDDEIENKADQTDKDEAAASAQSGTNSDDGSDTSANANANASNSSSQSTATDSSASNTGATATSSSANSVDSSDSASNTSTTAAAATASDSNQNLITPTQKPKAWFKKYFLALSGGLIGLIILLIVWFLRRSYVSDNVSSGVTPEMVQEKLNKINLDLNEPSIKDDK